jgi:micrococcal nuclease
MGRGVLLVLFVVLVVAGCAGAGPDATTTTKPPSEAIAESSPTQSSTPGETTKASGATTPTIDVTFDERWTVEVVRVIDGDTFEVRFPDGHTEDVRLLGVDTPEVHVAVDPAEFEGIPDSEAGRDWLRDWGHKASEFARLRVRGETVTIAVDPAADRRGSYGRLLVYVYVDGTNLNLALIEQGYARLYESEFSLREQFAAVETTARTNDVGLWNFDGSTTVPPTEATTTPPPVVADGGVSLVVAKIHADAAGNDHDNANDEYVVLENTGSSAIEMTGWTLRDEFGHRFEFPDGFTLGPGESVTIRTGHGTNTETTLYWGSDTAIWNNGGDTVIVRDADGTVVVKRAYT